MEIVDECTAFLLNVEALEILKNNVTREVSSGQRFQNKTNLATVLYEAISYLDSTPASVQNKDRVSQLLKAFDSQGFKLSRMEKIQIVNLRPDTLVSLHAMLDSAETRFNETQIGEILELVQLHLPQTLKSNNNPGSLLTASDITGPSHKKTKTS